MTASGLLAENEQRPIVIVSVGTDHHRFDRLIQWTEEFAVTRPDVAFVVQRGTSRSPKGVASQELIPHQEIQDMFRRAVAVVSHGGPSTVMDARGQGRLPIVVPRNPEFGEHVDGHQMRFAAHLQTNGIARVANSQEEFIGLLSKALGTPSEFAIDIADVIVPPGVLRLGEVLDGILGVTTRINGAGTGHSRLWDGRATSHER